MTLAVERTLNTINQIKLNISVIWNEQLVEHNWCCCFYDITTSSITPLPQVTDQYSAIMYNTTVAERGAELVTIKHLAQGVGSVVKDPALVGQSVVVSKLR